MMEHSATTVLPALRAWKPAKDAGFHIPTATATAAVKLGQTAKPPPITFLQILVQNPFFQSRIGAPQPLMFDRVDLLNGSDV